MKAALLVLLFCVRCFAADAITFTGQMTFSGQQQMVSGSFSAPAKALIIDPIDAAAHVALAGPITYANGGGATSFKVYLDASPTPVTPSTLVQNSAATSYVPTLAYATKYWARVDAVNTVGTTTGDIYSFDSLSTIPVDGYSSLDVGGSDGDQLTAAKMATGTELSLGTWLPHAIPPTNCLTGKNYQIISAGTTDWTAIGAADNNVGTQFTATGAGTGTGTCFINRMFVSTAPTTPYSPPQNGENIWTGATDTTAIKFGMDTQQCGVRLTLTTDVPTLAVGFYLTLGPIAGSNASVLDMAQITNALGGFCVPQLGANGKLHIHTETNGGSQVGADISGTTLGTTYWLTLHASEHGTTTNAGSLVTGTPYTIGTAGDTDWVAVGAANNNAGTVFFATGAGSGTGVANATDMLQVYTTAGVLVGTSSADTSAATNKASDYRYILLGRTDNHVGNNDPPDTSYAIYSQLMISTSALYPLGP